VQFAINLWVSIVLYSPEPLLPGLYGFIRSDNARLILGPLMCACSSRIRRQLANAIYQICTQVAAPSPASKLAAPSTVFLEALLALIPTDAQNAGCKLDADEFFGVVCKLLTVRDRLSLTPPPSGVFLVD
jgi:hypothetical protein